MWGGVPWGALWRLRRTRSAGVALILFPPGASLSLRRRVRTVGEPNIDPRRGDSPLTAAASSPGQSLKPYLYRARLSPIASPPPGQNPPSSKDRHALQYQHQAKGAVFLRLMHAICQRQHLGLSLTPAAIPPDGFLGWSLSPKAHHPMPTAEPTNYDSAQNLEPWLPSLASTALESQLLFAAPARR